MISYPRPNERSRTDPDDLRTELAAMQTVALALAALDPTTRDRVLRWAAERFRETPVPAVAPVENEPCAVAQFPPRAHASMPQALPEVEVSDLEEFFDADPQPETVAERGGKRSVR